MKKIFSIIILCLISILSFSQINFENGYFINNNNQRIECLIKNNDWKNNPTEFEYKLTTTSEVEKGSLSTVKEFGITGFSRYIRADVQVDVSSKEITKLSKDRNPEWTKKLLFLKVLVQGKASLFYFTGNGLLCFFYSVGDSTINQLIYKEYYADDDHIATNRKFREQLWINMRCENASMYSVEKVNFRMAELIKYVKKYNECNQIPALVYGKKEKNQTLHIRLTPGLTSSNIALAENFYLIYNTKLKNKLGFRFGAEVEYILPFNKNKWGYIVEPSFQHLNAEQHIGDATAKINYNSIEIATGIRHYFFLKNNCALLVDALFMSGYGINFNSNITYDYPFASPLKIKPKPALTLGVGVNYKRLNVETRYCFKRQMLNSFYFYAWNADYRNLSLIFSYKLI